MDLTKLKELAEAVCELREHADTLAGSKHMRQYEFLDVAADVIEWLIAEVERLTQSAEDSRADAAMVRSYEAECLRLLQEAEEERDRLKAENEALRKIISECATACGAGCHQECSLGFMAMLPDEIASVVGKLTRNAAIGAVVWQFIDRMTDVCKQDPAERILEHFVAAVSPAIDAAMEGGGI